MVNEISVCKSAIVLYSKITSNWPALKFPAATLRALSEKSVQLTWMKRSTVYWKQTSVSEKGWSFATLDFKSLLLLAFDLRTEAE